MRKPVINPGIINRLKMLFAIVQDGDTATRNIAKGKCVIWKNTPCRAITDISTGDTLSSVNLSTDAEGYINSVESNISNLQDGIAIVANGNTHPSVSLGQFVYVKNHDTLAEGLYKASSNIAVTDPLSTSNLVADDSGGLNALKSDVDTLSSKITDQDFYSENVRIGKYNGLALYERIFVIHLTNPQRETDISIPAPSGFPETTKITSISSSFFFGAINSIEANTPYIRVYVDNSKNIHVFQTIGNPPSLDVRLDVKYLD